MEKKSKHEFMTTTPIPKLVTILAIPAMISMLVTSLYNMVDTLFVGMIGDGVTDSSAVTVVFAYMAILQAIGFFFGQGSGNYISRTLGKQDYDEASKMASVGFFSSFLIGLGLLVFGIILIEPFALLLQANPDNMDSVKEYLFYILLGSPFIVSSFVLNNQLRFQGSAYYGMIGITVGAVLNIALDPLFMFTLKMGLGGAGLATSISQAVAFVVLFFMCRRGGNIRLSLKNFKPSWEKYKQIFIGGLPALCRQGLASVSGMVLNNVAYAVAGNAFLTGMGVAQRIMHFIFSVLLGLGQGYQPICGYNYGAKKYDRVKQGYFFCIWVSMALVAVFSVVCAILAPDIAKIINGAEAVYTAAGTSLRFQFCTFITMPFIVLTNMMLQNLGRVVGASTLAFMRQGAAYIPLMYLLQGLGRVGIFLVQPLADIITCIVAVPWAIREIKDINRRIEKQRTEEKNSMESSVEGA